MVRGEDWETPRALFHQLDEEFGFTVDVAASPKNAKCPRYYTREENGLSRDWGGEVVWCNPPYTRQVGRWVQKAAQTVGTVVMLLPVKTDTEWFHDWVLQRGQIRFLRGRLDYGDAGGRAPFASMLVIYGG